MKTRFHTFTVADAVTRGLARLLHGLIRSLPGPWLLIALTLHHAAHAQLAITEVMSFSATNRGPNVVVAGPDFWELSNFSTNDIELTGYRFNDNAGGINQAYTPAFAGLTIRAHESIIFYETNAFSADDFRAWWGLGTNVQVIPYPSSGYGFAELGDTVFLWPPDAVDEADFVDFFDFSQATRGSSFTYDSITGEWGVPSVLGVGGAFQAETADDLGSPGTHTGPVALSFSEQPISVLANPGDTATFSVRHRGLPRPTFQWFHNGTPIVGARFPTYTVASAQLTDAGAYVVVLSNYFQVVTSAIATLTVSTNPDPPRFVQSPTDLWVFPDQVATFRSVATGLPQPAYQWRKNGITIAGATERNLTIPIPHDLGTNVYSLVASNSLGAATNEAKLLVFERPDLRITELMAMEKDWAGSDHEDWWELTNFGTNPVDLFGYRFDDFTQTIITEPPLPTLQYAWTNKSNVIVSPDESIIFVENMSAEEFRRWWGPDNVPPSLQIITYTGGGLSFNDAAGDGLGLWNIGATRDDDFVHPWFASASYSELDLPDALGVSFTIDPDVPDDFCCYQFSQAGVNGAFVAAEGGDIGSPGYIRTPTDPRIILFKREPAGWRLAWRSVLTGTYHVQWRGSLTTGNWTDLATLPAAGSTTSYLDTTAPLGAQRFYRVVLEP